MLYELKLLVASVPLYSYENKYREHLKKYESIQAKGQTAHFQKWKIHLIMYKVAMTTGRNANILSVLGPAFGLALHLAHLYSWVNLVKNFQEIFLLWWEDAIFYWSALQNMLIFTKKNPTGGKKKKKLCSVKSLCSGILTSDFKSTLFLLNFLYCRF